MITITTTIETTEIYATILARSSPFSSYDNIVLRIYACRKQRTHHYHHTHINEEKKRTRIEFRSRCKYSRHTKLLEASHGDPRADWMRARESGHVWLYHFLIPQAKIREQRRMESNSTEASSVPVSLDKKSIIFCVCPTFRIIKANQFFFFF